MKRINDAEKEHIAKVISSLTHAPILSIPAFLIINYFEMDLAGFILASTICILFSVIIPIFIVICWTRKIKSHEIDLPNKEDRIVPLIIGFSSYIIGSIVLFLIDAPILSTALMFCYGTSTIVVTVISKFWKISIHAMGVMGPTVAMIFAFGPIGAVYGMILPPVMWSRYHLHKHTMGQLFAGAAFGFILTAVQTYLILDYCSMAVPNITEMAWLLYAFLGPCILLSVAGHLNHKGIKDEYTKKFFYCSEFISVIAFVYFTSIELSVIFIMISIIYVVVYYIAGKGFIWYDGMLSNSNYKNEPF